MRKCGFNMEYIIKMVSEQNPNRLKKIYTKSCDLVLWKIRKIRHFLNVVEPVYIPHPRPLRKHLSLVRKPTGYMTVLLIRGRRIRDRFNRSTSDCATFSPYNKLHGMRQHSGKVGYFEIILLV